MARNRAFTAAGLCRLCASGKPCSYTDGTAARYTWFDDDTLEEISRREVLRDPDGSCLARRPNSEGGRQRGTGLGNGPDDADDGLPANGAWRDLLFGDSAVLADDLAEQLVSWLHLDQPRIPDDCDEGIPRLTTRGRGARWHQRLLAEVTNLDPDDGARAIWEMAGLTQR